MYFHCSLVDPVTEESELGVDPRVSLPATAESPGDEATQDVEAGGAGERTAAVSLAGILAAQHHLSVTLLEKLSTVCRREKGRIVINSK